MTPDPAIWYYRGFGYLCQSFMLIWILWSKNDLKVSHRKQLNTPLNMNFVTSLIDFEYHICGIFEGISYHQEDESIALTIFAASVELIDTIKKLLL